uniref:Uncharacterized protein n=1 Tax=Megaviridae environmental sample TaxID=1737588 RepID=A0A5J6VP02_9VIRU|nr:MAG: hypothetical protein [Megaviridae environmental sample]
MFKKIVKYDKATELYSIIQNNEVGKESSSSPIYLSLTDGDGKVHNPLIPNEERNIKTLQQLGSVKLKKNGDKFNVFFDINNKRKIVYSSSDNSDKILYITITNSDEEGAWRATVTKTIEQ